jgi:hypothetical protein
VEQSDGFRHPPTNDGTIWAESDKLNTRILVIILATVYDEAEFSGLAFINKFEKW